MLKAFLSNSHKTLIKMKWHWQKKGDRGILIYNKQLFELHSWRVISQNVFDFEFPLVDFFCQTFPPICSVLENKVLKVLTDIEKINNSFTFSAHKNCNDGRTTESGKYYSYDLFSYSSRDKHICTNDNQFNQNQNATRRYWNTSNADVEG